MPTNKNDVLVGKKVQAIPAPEVEIGIDTDDALIDALIEGVDTDSVDVSELDSFTNVTQSREYIYNIIDAMASDDRVSAVLEAYAGDCVETNDKGQVVWCESDDSDVQEHVQYLLDVLNVDKNAYEWMYSLLRYGDLYLRLYRQSDYDKDNDFLFTEIENAKKQLNESVNPFDEIHAEEEGKKEVLQEDVKVSVHDDNDHYVYYVEMVPNPGEMFELTKFGKTRGYISAPINIQDTTDYNSQLANYLTYKLRQKDVTVYGATDFVHASLRNSNNLRNPEEVKIFKTEEDYKENTNAGVYKVKKGQSMLFNKFRVWRQLCMTENSILLDRVTKSALIRIIEIETAGLPKNKVREYVSRMKEKIEQKISLSVNQGTMANYTNPGPVVNSIFTPVKEGKGSLNIQTLGGDYDPKQLTDLDHLETRFYGAFRIPKAFFNLTDDGAGFNGGQSLAILSSSYGKAIKQDQNIFIQMLTDLVNLFCLDTGLSNYVNRFTLKMQTPVTQEEVDRRDNLRNRMGVINDVMQQINGFDNIDGTAKLKIYKTLLSSSITDAEVISILNDVIDKLENAEEENVENETAKGNKEEKKLNRPSREERPEEPESSILSTIENSAESPIEQELETGEGEPGEETSYLPSPNELDLDLTGNQ